MPREEKPVEQIPWAQYVKVVYLSDLSAELELSSGQKVEAWHKNFEWSGTFDSQKDIKDYMKVDEDLTHDLREFWGRMEEESREQMKPSSFQDKILKWLKGGVFQKQGPTGPKEWRPRQAAAPKIRARLDRYGYGNTYNEDNAYYWGDVFEFAHFKTDDGDTGAVIMWHQGGDPRGDYRLPIVYLGDFESFFDSQYEHDPWSYESFLHWNSTFENGLMWAWEKMGVFEDLGEEVTNLNDRHVKQVLDAIEKEPSILLPESVQKLLENYDFEDLPRQLQKALRWIMTNTRREIEKALGQKLLWENLYG